MPPPTPLDRATLQANAAIRLDDAQVLFDHGRYDGAADICGYAVEFALKARICETLNTLTYPDRIQGFKTHQLDTLLFLTGKESHVKQTALADWAFVLQNWQPEMRYKAAGTIAPADVQRLLEATRILLPLL